MCLTTSSSVYVSRHCFHAVCVLMYFFFFKQKTAYEMRISDWSSDVCSSDLEHPPPPCEIDPVAYCALESDARETPAMEIAGDIVLVGSGIEYPRGHR